MRVYHYTQPYVVNAFPEFLRSTICNRNTSVSMRMVQFKNQHIFLKIFHLQAKINLIKCSQLLITATIYSQIE